MNRKILNVLLLVGIVAGFSACKEDEDGAPGKFTFHGETHDLSKAFAANWDTWQNGDDTYYTWEISLTSSGVDYDETEKEFTGEGDVVSLSIQAINDDGFLPVGTYDPIGTVSTVVEKGWCWSDFRLIGYDFDEEDGVVDVGAQTVNATISKSGDVYTINFTIAPDTGETITGSYSGSVREVEY